MRTSHPATCPPRGSGDGTIAPPSREAGVGREWSRWPAPLQRAGGLPGPPSPECRLCRWPASVLGKPIVTSSNSRRNSSSSTQNSPSCSCDSSSAWAAGSTWLHPSPLQGAPFSGAEAREQAPTCSPGGILRPWVPSGQAPALSVAGVPGPSTKPASQGRLGPCTEQAAHEQVPRGLCQRPSKHCPDHGPSRRHRARARSRRLLATVPPALHGPHGQSEAQSARLHSPLPPGPLPAPPAPGVLNAQQQDAPAGQILELSQIRHDESMKLTQLPGPWGRNSRKVHTERTQACLLARDTRPPSAVHRRSVLTMAGKSTGA